ncbi:MaoC family dehydratase [Puniceibacterium sp. IMCC21224]|uniref:MaoC family dehydratase n=1 Tax=Puniceibacterium sp. IMCC21224 TaxID=1618204 RepID=UPI00064DE639|nr:MaoC family dehydratase [Puniceibacterium sp. IMCC21224]KMK66056.1 acyl dehydratase [Puniceibacterium sp. IMCC21224]
MSADLLRVLPPGYSRWYEMDQARIAAFADVTEDWQFIHLDEDRAAQTAFGGTIAHGFLTLSLLSAMSYEVVPELRGMRASVNYGFDRVRFVSPVRAGCRVRGRFAVASVDEGPGRLTVHWDVTLEIEDAEKPALVASWITRFEMEE